MNLVAEISAYPNGEHDLRAVIHSWALALAENLLWLAISNNNGTFTCIPNDKSRGHEPVGWKECERLLHVLPSPKCTGKGARFVVILRDCACIFFCNGNRPLLIVSIRRTAEPEICKRLFGMPAAVSNQMKFEIASLTAEPAGVVQSAIW